MKLTKEEAYVEKRFKKDKFTIEKLDDHNQYKAPDFKITKGLFHALVEVKKGFKKGKILESLFPNSFKIDPSYAVEDYFRESDQKISEYLKNNPVDSNLPYILVFTLPFFIDIELEWSNSYKKYKRISAVFMPQSKHRSCSKAYQLDKNINSQKIPVQSQIQLMWKVIKNTSAINPLNISEFQSVSSIKRSL